MEKNSPVYFYDVHSAEKIIQSSPLKIEQPHQIKQGVTLHQHAQGILLPSFVMLILGKPGSGKSHLISQLINNPMFYGNKFNRILYIGPTRFSNVIHDQHNTKTDLDIEWIIKRIKQSSSWCKNMLLVFDDVISAVPQTLKSRMQQLFFNRRHQLQHGCISIIITSQKFTCVPTWIRTTLNSMITFGIPQSQIRKIVGDFTLKKSKDYVMYQYRVLQKHHFIYHNLETGTSYNDQFKQL